MFNFNISFIILQCNITSNDQCFSFTVSIFPTSKFSAKGINLQQQQKQNNTKQNKTKTKNKTDNCDVFKCVVSTSSILFCCHPRENIESLGRGMFMKEEDSTHYNKLMLLYDHRTAVRLKQGQYRLGILAGNIG